MLNAYSKDLLAYLSGLLGLMLVVVAMVVLFGFGLVSLYQLFRSDKKWDDVRKQFTRKLAMGLDFMIAGQLTFMASSHDPQTLMTLLVLAVVRGLLGYSIVKEAKA